MCPADYDDAQESDSDIFKDHDYLLQEPPSPNSTQGGQSSPVTPVPSERIFSIAGYIVRDSSDVLEQ